jgi:hypothetical protein
VAISYTRRDWQNDPAGATPIDEANLDRMEQGIVDAVTAINGTNPAVVIPSGGSTAGIPDGTLIYELVPTTGGQYVFPKGDTGPAGPAGTGTTSVPFSTVLLSSFTGRLTS